jgi:ADP-ribose pyrophosphatase
VKSNQAAGDRDGWETISSQTHFESAHLRVVTEEVRSPARAQARRWTVVHRKAAVVVAPMTAAGKLVLIRQERIPIRAALWEVPAGQVDEEGESEMPDTGAVALRELREETGYQLSTAGQLMPLGDFFSSPGFTDERAYLFLARPVELGADGPAHSESESILECREFSAGEISEMIASDEIRDANTLAICARLVARGFLSLRG